MSMRLTVIYAFWGMTRDGINSRTEIGTEFEALSPSARSVGPARRAGVVVLRQRAAADGLVSRTGRPFELEVVGTVAAVGDRDASAVAAAGAAGPGGGRTAGREAEAGGTGVPAGGRGGRADGSISIIDRTAPPARR